MFSGDGEASPLVEKGIPECIFQKDKVTDEIMAAYRYPFKTRKARHSMLHFVREIPVGGAGPAAKTMANIEDRLRLLNVPVVIIWGMKDPVLSRCLSRSGRNTIPTQKLTYSQEPPISLRRTSPRKS